MPFDRTQKHRVAGPCMVPPCPSHHTSPFGVIPKRHQPGKWRLILYPSSPLGSSVKDGIPKDPFPMHYVSVHDAIRTLVKLEPGAQMAKFDVQVAYRLPIIAFLPVSLLGRFSDSRPAIIASVSIEREHRLCCFCPSWSSASPRGMRGASHVFSLSRHRAQLSNPNC